MGRLVYVECFLLLLDFVHTQISFPWSSQFGKGPDWKNSQVLLRAGLLPYKHGLLGISTRQSVKGVNALYWPWSFTLWARPAWPGKPEKRVE